MSAVKVLVPVSGGKDSQACLKLALEHYPAEAVRGLFCDTQWEHPLTYQHIELMKLLYGVRIDTVSNGTVPGQCLKHSRIPGSGSRFCTEELKIWPTKWYCRDLAKAQGGFEVWYGMRSNESPERTKRYAGMSGDDLYLPHEVQKKYPKYLSKLGVWFRLPILEWSKGDVIDFVGWNNLNPLYRDGFDRVGCFPCEASGDVWKAKAYTHDAFGFQQWKRINIVAEHIRKPVFQTKGHSVFNADLVGSEEGMNAKPGCAICSI